MRADFQVPRYLLEKALRVKSLADIESHCTRFADMVFERRDISLVVWRVAIQLAEALCECLNDRLRLTKVS